MTDVSKEAVDALLRGVTEGPWTIEYAGGTICLMMGEKCQMCSEAYYPWVPDNEHDWVFIAAARELVPALRAALDEAEARAVKAEAERDAANALLRDGLLSVQTWRNEPIVNWAETVAAHLGAKP